MQKSAVTSIENLPKSILTPFEYFIKYTPTQLAEMANTVVKGLEIGDTKSLLTVQVVSQLMQMQPEATVARLQELIREGGL